MWALGAHPELTVPRVVEDLRAHDSRCFILPAGAHLERITIEKGAVGVGADESAVDVLAVDGCRRACSSFPVCDEVALVEEPFVAGKHGATIVTGVMDSGA